MIVIIAQCDITKQVVQKSNLIERLDIDIVTYGDVSCDVVLDIFIYLSAGLAEFCRECSDNLVLFAIPCHGIVTKTSNSNRVECLSVVQLNQTRVKERFAETIHTRVRQIQWNDTRGAGQVCAEDSHDIETQVLGTIHVILISCVTNEKTGNS